MTPDKPTCRIRDLEDPMSVCGAPLPCASHPSPAPAGQTPAPAEGREVTLRDAVFREGLIKDAGRLIGFLRSCILSGESLSPEDEAMIKGWFDEARSAAPAAPAATPAEAEAAPEVGAQPRVADRCNGVLIHDLEMLCPVCDFPSRRDYPAPRTYEDQTNALRAQLASRNAEIAALRKERDEARQGKDFAFRALRDIGVRSATIECGSHHGRLCADCQTCRDIAAIQSLTGGGDLKEEWTLRHEARAERARADKAEADLRTAREALSALRAAGQAVMDYRNCTMGYHFCDHCDALEKLEAMLKGGDASAGSAGANRPSVTPGAMAQPATAPAARALASTEGKHAKEDG